MNIALEDNFDFSYYQLQIFLSEGEQGYMFCRADNQYLISRINENLRRDLHEKGIDCSVLFLKAESDVPLLAQIEQAAAQCDCLIVGNLSEIVNTPENGLRWLTQLNFAREALWAIGRPILFWADERSMHLIINHAYDLYSQRRQMTVHFTGTADMEVAAKLPREGWEQFLASEEYKELQAEITLLERRLHGAKEKGYPEARLFAEIALPLARRYARLGLGEDARKLLVEYESQTEEADDPDVLQELGQVYYSLHDYPQAISLLRRANELLEMEYGNRTEYPLQWYDNLRYIVEWSEETGRSTTLLGEIQAAASVLEADEGTEWKLPALSVFRNLQGDIARGKGQLQDARTYYEQGLKISEQVNRANPHSEQLQRDLGVSFNKLGDTLAALGQLSAAKNYYEEGLNIREQLSRANPNSEQFQRDLTVSYDRLGNSLAALGQLTEAKGYYEQGLKIREQLSRANPNSELLQRDVGVSLNKLGNLFAALGQLSNAKRYYEQGLKISEQLSRANPHSERLHRDLGVSFIKLGNTLDALGHFKEAKGYYEQALKVSQQLSGVNPHSEQLQRDLAVSFFRLANILVKEKAMESGLGFYTKALEIFKNLLQANPHSQQLKNDVASTESKIKSLSEADNSASES